MSAAAPSTTKTPGSHTRIESWAIAAVGIVDRYGSPLLLRTYTSPEHVLKSPDAPLQAHLLVTPEDTVRLHFLLFSSIDRCNELVETQREVLRNTSRAALAAAKASSAGPSSSNGTGAAAAPRAAPPSVLPRQLNAYQLPLDNPTFSSGRQGTVRGGGGSGAASTGAIASPGTATMNSNSSDPRFVGKLIQGYRFTSYGLVSASGVRTILVTVGTGDAPLDAVVPLCRTVYESASVALCNPLRTPSMCWRMQSELAELRRAAYVEAAKQLPLSLPASRTGPTAASLPSPDAPSAGAQTDASTSASEAAAEAESVWLQAAALRTSSLDRAGRLKLPAGTTELGWCRAAPRGLGASVFPEPTLAYSKVLHDQLESLLPPFTATARSCIIH